MRPLTLVVLVGEDIGGQRLFNYDFADRDEQLMKFVALDWTEEVLVLFLSFSIDLDFGEGTKASISKAPLASIFEIDERFLLGE